MKLFLFFYVVFKERGEVIDEELIRVFVRVKWKFNDYDEFREVFYDVWDDIIEVVKICFDNVRVVIYIDDVFDDLIVVGIGVEENWFWIFIRSNGKVLYSWIKEMWSKIFCDGWEGVKLFIKKIFGFIVLKVRSVFVLVKEIFFVIVFIWICVFVKFG